jgi:hypothetical protein
MSKKRTGQPSDEREEKQVPPEGLVGSDEGVLDEESGVKDASASDPDDITAPFREERGAPPPRLGHEEP